MYREEGRYSMKSPITHRFISQLRFACPLCLAQYLELHCSGSQSVGYRAGATSKRGHGSLGISLSYTFRRL